MTMIRIRRRHRLGARRARQLASNIARDLERDYGMAHHWRDSVLQFHRSGIKGSLEVAEDSIELNMELGLAMRPFRERIEAGVASRLDALLDEAAGQA